MVVCYSPNGGYQSEKEYLSCYPGDDLVDILGVDEYEWPNSSNIPELSLITFDALIAINTKTINIDISIIFYA